MESSEAFTLQQTYNMVSIYPLCCFVLLLIVTPGRCSRGFGTSRCRSLDFSRLSFHLRSSGYAQRHCETSRHCSQCFKGVESERIYAYFFIGFSDYLLQALFYSLPFFWSSIVIVKDMPLPYLDFLLSKCTDGDVSITLSLVNVRRIYGEPATAQVVDRWIDAVFDRISVTSRRWTSFDLDTDNHLVFGRVHFRCLSLFADSLRSFKVSYTRLSGSSNHLSTAAEQLPTVASCWFRSDLLHLTHLSSFCVPLHWNADHLFDGLEFVELADFSCPIPIPLHILPRLFAVAGRMRYLKLGSLVPFLVPGSYRLASTSLEVLDIDFDTGPLAGDLLSAMDVPSLTDLTVRDVYRSVHCLLACPLLLGRLTRFCVHADIGDSVSLQLLFDLIPRLQVLDLCRTRSDVFYAYHDWALLRVPLERQLFFIHLRALYLPEVDLTQLVRVVNLVAECVPSGVRRVGIDRVRVERPSDPSPFYESMSWLRAVVPDFAFTRLYSRAGSTYNLLSFSSAHSLLR